MKRTPLKRKTPLSRGTSQLKRSRLKPVSDKTRQRQKEAEPYRQAMREQFKECWRCGNSEKKRLHGVPELNRIVVHEIANGADRLKAIDKPYATLILCGYCNTFCMEGVTSQAEQLAILMIANPDGYDLAAFNALVGFGPERITQSEVDQFLDPLGEMK